MRCDCGRGGYCEWTEQQTENGNQGPSQPDRAPISRLGAAN